MKRQKNIKSSRGNLLRQTMLLRIFKTFQETLGMVMKSFLGSTKSLMCLICKQASHCLASKNIIRRLLYDAHIHISLLSFNQMGQTRKRVPSSRKRTLYTLSWIVGRNNSRELLFALWLTQNFSTR